jgi:hypothetical protein
MFECPNLYTFDPSLPDYLPCRYTNNQASLCIKFDCSKPPSPNANEKYQVSYPYFAKNLGLIAVMCRGGTVRDVVKCGPFSKISDKIQYTLGCELNCESEGQKAAHETDVMKFYSCFRNDKGGFTAMERKCFNGYSFNRDNLQCVKNPL